MSDKIKRTVHFNTKCKVCDNKSSLYGVMDFNKNCGEQMGCLLPYLGFPIWYYQCDTCRLIFTRAMDDWSVQDFKDHIYNDEYALVDPDYAEHRPQSNAALVREMVKTSETILDYGGGNGRTAELLRQAGYQAESYDPIVDEPRPEKKYDVVISIEVFEHVPNPRATFADAVSFLKPGGRLIFTTLCNDELKPRELCWYIAPRNGHILMHSRVSLQRLGDQLGYNVAHKSNSLHIATQR